MLKNITISIDEEVLEAGREYAKKHNTSLNALIRRLLAQTVLPEKANWLEECFERMDQVQDQADSQGKQWSREELYDV